MRFEVRSSPRFDRDLRRAPGHVVERAIAALDELSVDPLTPRPGFDVRPLSDGLHRLRIGSWRLLYAVDITKRIVYVTKVSKRSTAYRGA